MANVVRLQVNRVGEYSLVAGEEPENKSSTKTPTTPPQRLTPLGSGQTPPGGRGAQRHTPPPHQRVQPGKGAVGDTFTINTLKRRIGSPQNAVIETILYEPCCCGF